MKSSNHLSASELRSRLRASERRLHEIIERSPDAFVIVDRDGMVQFANRAAAALFGMERSRLVGQVFGLPLVSGQKTDVDIVSSSGTALVAEMRVLESTWDGNEALIAVLRDITDLSEAERIRESEHRLALAMEVARLGFWDIDVASGRLLANERLSGILGYAPGEIEPRVEAWDRLVHPEDPSPFRYPFPPDGGPAAFRAELRARAKSGEWRWLLCQAGITECNAAGDPRRIVGVGADITERKQLEEALQQLNADLERRIEERTAELAQSNTALERSNAYLRQFAYVAAHDLQTPLRSITGFAQLLHSTYEGQLDAQADAWLGHLLQASRHMHELIRDLLTYSQLTVHEGRFRPVDTQALFEEVLVNLEAAIRDSGAQVTGSGLPIVVADRTQLGQVFQNLIDNGIKYCREKPPRVRVSACRQAGGWEFTVRDNGIGIDPKYHDRIFELFRRLHSQQQYPGTGIGLALCRRIINRHGGRIWVESGAGQGSVFHFTLPDAQETPESPA